VNRAAKRLGLLASISRAIMCRSPEALALGLAVISFRRRYHCPSFVCLLTGLATADWPPLRCGTDALFCLVAKGSALARARVKSRKIRDRPGRSPRPSAQVTTPRTLTLEIRLCRPGDPPPPRPPLPLLPRSRRRAGVQAQVRSAPKP
jgi:hypothetical protein